MATHKSAEKRHRQSLRNKARNRFAKTTIKSAEKKLLELAKAKGDKKAIDGALREATKLYDKAIVHGSLHKNNAQRHISRLTKQVNALRA